MSGTYSLRLAAGPGALMLFGLGFAKNAKLVEPFVIISDYFCWDRRLIDGAGELG